MIAGATVRIRNCRNPLLRSAVRGSVTLGTYLGYKWLTGASPLPVTLRGVEEELTQVIFSVRSSVSARLARAPGLLRGALPATLATSGAIQALNVVTGITLARGLGPRSRGEVAAVFLWVMLVASAGQIGLPEAVTYYTASTPRRASVVLEVALRIALLLSLPLVLIGALTVTLVLGHYGATTLTAGFLALTAIPLYMGTNITVASLQGLSAIRSFNAVRGLQFILTAAALVSFAVVHALTVRTATYSYLAAFGITFVVALAVLRAHGVVRTGFDRGLSRALLGYGLRSQASFVTSTLIERLDQLLISVMLGAALLGLYVVAVTLTTGASLVAYTIGLVAFPRVAALADISARATIARRYLLISVVLSMALVLPMVAFTPQLLDLLFGHAFVKIASVCRVLIIASVFLAFTQLLTSLLRGLGRPFDVARAGGVGLVVTVVLLCVLLPTIGLMGAATASLVAYGVTAIMMLKRVACALDLSTAQFVFGAPNGPPIPAGRLR